MKRYTKGLDLRCKCAARGNASCAPANATTGLRIDWTLPTRHNPPELRRALNRGVWQRDTERSGAAGRRRVVAASRTARALRRLKRWWSASWIVERWWKLDNWFFNWWHPPSDSAYPGYGYSCRSRRGRLSRAWRALRHLTRKSAPVNAFTTMLWRLHEWWYPPSKDAYPSYASYGRGRKSRLALAHRRLFRRIKGSAVGRRCAEWYERFYEWRYPVVEDPYPYYGYYGRKRKSRPVILWRKFKRWLRNSWLGERCREYSYRFYDWWYPPVPASQGHYPHYGHRRVSRPVLVYRRWHHWFRKTWVGREFGWILDESEVLLVFLQIETAQAFSRRRLQRFFSRKRNLAALAVVVLVVVAGIRYGRPRYRHYLETQYAQQAEQFVSKGDFSRAYLRVRQVMRINPDNITACRVNAELADWANSPFAIYWRQRTVLLSPTATNRLALASTALRAEPFPFATASKTLGEIDPASQRTANYQMVAGALAIRLGHLHEAEQHYSEALKLQPDNPATRMSLAVVQLQSKDPKVVTDSRLTLELLNADGKLGIMPLRSLVAESAGARDFARAEQLSSQILTNAQASFSDRMLHLSILRAAARTNFQSFLKETQQKALEHPVYVGELVAWLNHSGYAADALKWVQELPRQVSSQGLIPLAEADSYVALGKWKELELYLEAERWIGQDHVRIAMLALAMRKQAGNQGSVTGVGKSYSPGVGRSDRSEHACTDGVELGLGNRSGAGALACGDKIPQADLAHDFAAEPGSRAAGYRQPAADLPGDDATRSYQQASQE